MTKKEAVVIEAYTGVCMLTGDDRSLFYKYINQLMGRKVYMYEILALEREIKEKAEPDFIKICKNMDKKIKTRKLRAMTNAEFCDKCQKKYHLRCNDGVKFCPLFFKTGCGAIDKPCKVNGKYILIEAKE